MLAALREPPAHHALLNSSCSAQAGAAFLLPATDTQLAVPAETHKGKVQSVAKE